MNHISIAALAIITASPDSIFGRQLTSLQGASPLLHDFDALGPWYEDVYRLELTGFKNETAHALQKNALIAIVGAGISGLATALMLDSVGVHNWEIIEASDRVGGRFRTKYVGGTQEWAEMGPMRLPYSVKYKTEKTLEYSDHHMVYQLAEILNDMNENDLKWKIDFIPWIQHHPKELLGLGTGRLQDGRIPTRAEIEANSSLSRPAPLSTDEYKQVKARMDTILKNETTLKSIQRNVWRAHGKAMEDGLDDWSQQAWLRHVFQASENVTDAITTTSDYDVFWDELHHNSNLALDGGPTALALTEWKCVDGGFNRLSDAFLPHVQDLLVLDRQIRKLQARPNPDGRTRTKLLWQESSANRTWKSKEYDYTFMTVPFTKTRFMDLPPFSSVLNRAISEPGLQFKSACKVALLFSERFWEESIRYSEGIQRPQRLLLELFTIQFTD